jgi:hypothetical protein
LKKAGAWLKLDGVAARQHNTPENNKVTITSTKTGDYVLAKPLNWVASRQLRELLSPAEPYYEGGSDCYASLYR